ncbi:MAG TPA: hypothetical protein VMJ10_16890, partial [Kofleriaceae bacterium]|nr:hypothetical protein [Kofleriaceae bacterium]
GWVFFRAGSTGQALDVIAAMFGRTGSVAGPAGADIFPHFAQLAMIAGTAIVLAPIAGRYRAWRPRIPVALASAACWLVFTGSAIHLTNMRITPLIYFKF